MTITNNLLLDLHKEDSLPKLLVLLPLSPIVPIVPIVLHQIQIQNHRLEKTRKKVNPLHTTKYGQNNISL